MEKLGDVKKRGPKAKVSAEPTRVLKKKEGSTPERELTNSARPQRKKFKRGGKLHAAVREGYQRIWLVDHPGEIEEYQERGWKKVKRADGEYETRPAGQGKTHMLMEIAKEFYLEDMAEQQRLMDENLREIIAPKPGEYIPDNKRSGLSTDNNYYSDIQKELQK